MLNPSNQFGWSHNPNDLAILMSREVLNWLEEKQKRFILDYINIKEGYKQFGIIGLSDYSYLITPIFKALEGVLIQIAEEIGLDIEKYQFKIGVVFSEENLEKFYNDVLEKLESLSDENKEDIKMWLNDTRRILRHFRHSPAHFSGEVKPSWDKAFLFGDHVLSIIDNLCSSLLEAGIISVSKEEKSK